MRLQLILLISFVFNSSIAYAVDDKSKTNNGKATTFSEESKSFFALNCYAANYIFLQYIIKSNKNYYEIKTKLEKQIEFFGKSSIVNMKKENIDDKTFENMNELNLKYFNSALPSNNKIDFKGILWQELHQCNIKFESLRHE